MGSTLLRFRHSEIRICIRRIDIPALDRKFACSHLMNFRHPLYPIVSALEHRFGGMSIAGLIRYLSVFQFLVAILNIARPLEQDAGEITGYLTYLTFNLDKIQNLEVWRVFSFMFVNGSSQAFLIPLITMLIMWFVSDVLEQAWGAYKVNLFVFSTVGLQALALFLMSPLISPAGTEVMSLYCGRFLYASIFMITATYVPDYEFRLAFIIPVKLKWLALVVFAFALLQAIQFGAFGFFLLGMSLLPFGLVFVPKFLHNWKHQQKAAQRRQKFKMEQMPEGDVFHRCVRCGVTDVDQPDMDFRVLEDGQEYCIPCIEEMLKESS